MISIHYRESNISYNKQYDQHQVIEHYKMQKVKSLVHNDSISNILIQWFGKDKDNDIRVKGKVDMISPYEDKL